MDGDKIQELLLDYINGHLDEHDTARIEAALKANASLRGELQLIQREIFIMRSSTADPLEDVRIRMVSDKVIRSLRERRNRSYRALSPAMRSYLRAAITLAFLVVILIVFFALSPDTLQVNQVADEGQGPLRNEALVPPGMDEPGTERKLSILFDTENPRVTIDWTVTGAYDAMTVEERER